MLKLGTATLSKLPAGVARPSYDRAQLRRGRRQKGLKQVAIVGYTNAGKSTLLNALTGADAYVENRLFATNISRVSPSPMPEISSALP